MSGSKIQLSKDELDLVKNSAWILTKNRVLKKVEDGLAELSERMRQHMTEGSFHYDEVLKSVGPRISRGERYEGLPWLVLDYPRIFGREDIFAIRTFFWWGRHCSVSIHCRGRFLGALKAGINAERARFRDQYFIATDGDEWVHDQQAAPWKPFTEQNIDAAEFLRLGTIVQMAQWDVMEEKLFEFFKSLIKTME